jgi:hypothetical protein
VNEPAKFIQGEKVTWDSSYVMIPATNAGATFIYELRRADGKQTIPATPNGLNWRVTIAAVDSAKIIPGKYAYQGWEKDSSGASYCVVQGTIEVGVNLALQNAGYDTRTHYEKCLQAVRLALEGRSAHADQELEFMGRRIVRMSIKDLMDAEARLTSLVAAEQRALLRAQGKTGGQRQRLIQFTNPT